MYCLIVAWMDCVQNTNELYNNVILNSIKSLTGEIRVISIKPMMPGGCKFNNSLRSSYLVKLPECTMFLSRMRWRRGGRCWLTSRCSSSPPSTVWCVCCPSISSPRGSAPASDPNNPSTITSSTPTSNRFNPACSTWMRLKKPMRLRRFGQKRVMSCVKTWRRSCSRIQSRRKR